MPRSPSSVPVEVLQGSHGQATRETKSLAIVDKERLASLIIQQPKLHVSVHWQGQTPFMNRMPEHNVAVRTAQRIQWYSGEPPAKTLLIVSGRADNIPRYRAAVCVMYSSRISQLHWIYIRKQLEGGIEPAGSWSGSFWQFDAWTVSCGSICTRVSGPPFDSSGLVNVDDTHSKRWMYIDLVVKIRDRRSVSIR